MSTFVYCIAIYLLIILIYTIDAIAYRAPDFKTGLVRILMLIASVLAFLIIGLDYLIIHCQI